MMLMVWSNKPHMFMLCAPVGRAEISTAITISAPILLAVCTGIGLTKPPSTYLVLPMVAGTNTLGILHDARTA